ncbi:toll/interleukin-1 receptor domain-containing protein [Streptomyces sp. NPDC004291]
MSHGSGKDAEVVEALKIIAPELHDRGYDVFMDVDKLRVGDPWSPALYEQMYLCDAAIVLLGPNTIAESDWVRRESEVLMSRRFVRSLRTVLPCFLGTTKTKLARDRGFGSLLTLQAEMGQREKNPLPKTELTMKIAQWVLDEFAPIAGPPGDRAFFAWAKRISSYLRVARKQDYDSLVDIADALKCSTDEVLHVRASVGAELFLAHMLFRTGEAVRQEPENLLPAAVAALRSSLGSDRLRHLVSELVPSWVDPDAAMHFAPAHPPRNGGASPLILLRARAPWAAEQHIKRALCNAPRAFKHRALTAYGEIPQDEESPYEELLERCHEALREVFDIPPGYLLEPSRVQPRERREYLLVNANGYDLKDVADVVNLLHKDYPWLVIVVLHPELLPEENLLDDLDMSRAVKVDFSEDLEIRSYSFMRDLEEVSGHAV